MPHLIDSDWTIDYLAGVEQALQLLQQLAPSGIAISIVTYMEGYQGVLRQPDPEAARRQLEAFIQAVPILPFSRDVAERCAQLREDLRRQGRRVRSRALDLIVAATALEHGLILVTRNRDDYKHIPGLTLL
jgi:predicted nucleic acid-binding protein